MKSMPSWRVRLATERMIRFVVAPDRRLVPDLVATLPGRGIWLSAAGDVIETARAQGGLGRAFARAARGPVIVPPDLPAVLETAGQDKRGPDANEVRKAKEIRERALARA